MEIKFEDIKKRIKFHEIERDVVKKIKRNWKFYLWIIIMVSSVITYWLLYKPNAASSIEWYYNEIKNITVELEQNNLEQKQIYSDLKKNATKYQELLSWSKYLDKEIDSRRKKINLLIKGN